MALQPGSSGAYTFSDVCVVMGTYNEAPAVGAVIDEIDQVTDGEVSILCIDSSSDGTPEIARDRGATVIEQPPQGYGMAVKTALHAADRPIVVTTDCDGTYPMKRLPDFLAAINAGADVVSGDRMTRGASSMPPLNRVGNIVFARLASALAGARVHDTTTGMRAYRRSVIEAIEWTENTGLSAELLLRPLVRGYRVREVPIDYHERVGDSTLHPLTGGLAILSSIVSVCVQERKRRRG